jgi:hypothetical protein
MPSISDCLNSEVYKFIASSALPVNMRKVMTFCMLPSSYGSARLTGNTIAPGLRVGNVGEQPRSRGFSFQLLKTSIH